MRLFEIDPDTREVLLNKAWIGLVPEFRALLDRDKGSKGDYRGGKKLQAMKELTFLYFFCDFTSPIRDWELEEKRKEALYYANLKEEDIDDPILVAMAKYEEMQLKAARQLRTLKALYKGLDALDTALEEDTLFTATDKMGRNKYSVSDFTADTIRLEKAYDAIHNFEKKVEDDLKKATSGIRGPNSTLGDLEGQKKAWSESDVRQGSEHVAGDRAEPVAGASFANLMGVIQLQAKKEREQQRKQEEEN